MSDIETIIVIAIAFVVGMFYAPLATILLDKLSYWNQERKRRAGDRKSKRKEEERKLALEARKEYFRTRD